MPRKPLASAIAPHAKPGDPRYDRLKSWLDVEIVRVGSYAQACLWFLDGVRDTLHPSALEWATEMARGEGPSAQRALEFLDEHARRCPESAVRLAAPHAHGGRRRPES